MMLLVTGEEPIQELFVRAGCNGLSSDPGKLPVQTGRWRPPPGWARRGLADWPIRNPPRAGTDGAGVHRGVTSPETWGSGFPGYDAGGMEEN